jgi:hypothetical protein
MSPGRRGGGGAGLGRPVAVTRMATDTLCVGEFN